MLFIEGSMASAQAMNKQEVRLGVAPNHYNVQQLHTARLHALHCTIDILYFPPLAVAYGSTHHLQPPHTHCFEHQQF